MIYGMFKTCFEFKNEYLCLNAIFCVCLKLKKEKKTHFSITKKCFLVVKTL